MICRICGGEAVRRFSGRLRDAFTVGYHHCPRCEFLFTDEPTWLAGSGVKSVSEFDTGILVRNQQVARFAAVLFRLLLDPGGRFLDYGGGYGLFTRLMRDHGFDFFWHDPFSENLFARGFEFHPGSPDRFDAVTAIEVFEHLPAPRDLMDFCFRDLDADSLFFTTELYGPTPPPHDEWWYYSRESGQHISFYNGKTMRFFAEAYGLSFLSYSGNLHLFTRRKISPRLFRLVCRHSKRIFSLLKWRSRAMEDLRTLQEERGAGGSTDIRRNKERE